ncbi:MAG TPA: hypothetical protein VK972_03220 [Wenzhouxiangella sp.]|nr:hypothetical protein [Wenzhouxiangella sp.]
MTTLCIDELSSRLKRRWGWGAAATHIPADADCPLLIAAQGERTARRCERAAMPAWLEPQRGFDQPPGLAAFHGKTLPSMG